MQEIRIEVPNDGCSALAFAPAIARRGPGVFRVRLEAERLRGRSVIRTVVRDAAGLPELGRVLSRDPRLAAAWLAGLGMLAERPAPREFAAYALGCLRILTGAPSVVAGHWDRAGGGMVFTALPHSGAAEIRRTLAPLSAEWLRHLVRVAARTGEAVDVSERRRIGPARLPTVELFLYPGLPGEEAAPPPGFVGLTCAHGALAEAESEAAMLLLLLYLAAASPDRT